MPCSAASLQAAITAMMRFTDDQGRPAGTRPTLLVVPPELYWEATILLTSAHVPGPGDDGQRRTWRSTPCAGC